MTTDLRASVLEWLAAWEACIRSRDYDAARQLFDVRVTSFGTVADVANGIDELVERQWRRTWDDIDDFGFDHADAVVLPAAGGHQAVVAVTWRSTGRDLDGDRFPRPGRATVVLERSASSGSLVAVHTHFSLNRAVPDTASHRTEPSD